MQTDEIILHSEGEAGFEFQFLTRGKINGEDALRRLCQKLSKEEMHSWMAVGEKLIYQAIPSQWIADRDSTVIPKYAYCQAKTNERYARTNKTLNKEILEKLPTMSLASL